MLARIMLSLIVALVPPAAFAARHAPEALHPVRLWLTDDRVDRVYPHAAGNFVVFTEHSRQGFRVVRVNRQTPEAMRRLIRPLARGEQIRDGVAIADGGVGYVTNRIGPISAWLKEARGDAHVAIANLGVWSGAIAPMHLAADRDGQRWCFDTTLEKTRYNQLLQAFTKPAHWELIGQGWRLYDSRLASYKLAYERTVEGAGGNHFAPPMLFLFDRATSALVMIPNAFGCALSPDGTRLAFVRLVRGNYDIWMQDLTNGRLVQLTTSPYADLEPAFSPDGTRLAFVSNRDTKGEVRRTSIYVLDLASGQIARVTNATAASDGGPTWLDAHTILFHSNRDPKHPQTKTDGRWRLWIVDISH